MTQFEPLPTNINFQNKKRKFGFEIEYTDLEITKSAAIIQKTLGGKVKKQSDLIYSINTDLGEFEVTLDVNLLQDLSRQAEQKKQEKLINLEKETKDLLTPIVDSFMPYEIVAPPLEFEDFPKLTKIVDKLRKAGAKGTKAGLIYAFGIHINAELPSLEVNSILSYLQSFLLLDEWLEEEMEIDFSRKLTPFIKPFSQKYKNLVLNPEYKPQRTQFINDYLEFNPTRNRPLDLLPVFAFINKDKIDDEIDSNLVQARPTYHFRMANCRIDEAEWNLQVEWNSWIVVEYLAHNNQLRARMLKDYAASETNKSIFSQNTWLDKTKDYVSEISK
ncbi:MAG: amidoligase family protein [Myxococcota bacterium]